ncbi:hypothetical protein OROGR_026570 [Orobanche gracilis]
MNVPTYEALVNKPTRKKKTPSQNPEIFQSPGDSIKSSHDMRTTSSRKEQRACKRGVVNEVSAEIQPERLDLMADSSTAGDDYRALRRKYLLLEEESFGLGQELKLAEDDIKTLEEEKLSLLDELVVLEGLVDRSDIQPRGHRLQ